MHVRTIKRANAGRYIICSRCVVNCDDGGVDFFVEDQLGFLFRLVLGRDSQNNTKPESHAPLTIANLGVVRNLYFFEVLRCIENT